MVAERKSKSFARMLALRAAGFQPGKRFPRRPLDVAGVKEHGMERFARAFAEAGFVVLVHDYRHFGARDFEE
jgi:hypothetical protein